MPEERPPGDIAYCAIVELHSIAPPGSTRFGMQVNVLLGMPVTFMMRLGLAIGNGFVFVIRIAACVVVVDVVSMSCWQFAPEVNMHDVDAMVCGAARKKYISASTIATTRNAHP